MPKDLIDRIRAHEEIPLEEYNKLIVATTGDTKPRGIDPRERHVLDPETQLDLAAGRANSSSPEHPEYSADRCLAESLFQGRSFLVLDCDGVGTGGQMSAAAAELVQKRFQQECALLKNADKMFSVDEAREWFTRLLVDMAPQIKTLQVTGKDDQIDTTFTAMIVCLEITKEGYRRPVLLTCNVGDSRLYRYDPRKGELLQLTHDQTEAERLTRVGLGKREELEEADAGRIIRRAVGMITPDLLQNKRNEFFEVQPFDPGYMYMAGSDGLSGQYEPNDRVTMAEDLRAAMGVAYKNQAGFGGIARAWVDIARARDRKVDDVSLAMMYVKKTPALEKFFNQIANFKNVFADLGLKTQPGRHS